MIDGNEPSNDNFVVELALAMATTHVQMNEEPTSLGF